MADTLTPVTTHGVELFLSVAGLIAGFVDSIAGGGGLITLPSISLILGPGPNAIGTNKICSFASALIALLVYMRGGHFDWRRSFSFTVATAIGAFLGSRLSPLVPPSVFLWLLVATCPLILYIVWRKDLWVAHEQQDEQQDEEQQRQHQRFHLRQHTATGVFRLRNTPSAINAWLQPPVIVAGLTCGIYDGLWGPGGGTFMFLSLLFIVRMPLLGALAATKLANMMSALTSLTSYAMQGYVHPREGLILAVGAMIGGFIGARQASTNASRIVRPVLIVVATLLMVKVLAEYVYAV